MQELIFTYELLVYYTSCGNFYVYIEHTFAWSLLLTACYTPYAMTYHLQTKNNQKAEEFIKFSAYS